MTEIHLGYYALAVAILAECSPETAFEKFQSERPSEVRPIFYDVDIEKMRRLKGRGLSYRQIGLIFNVPWTTVYGRIRPRNSMHPDVGGSEVIKRGVNNA